MSNGSELSKQVRRTHDLSQSRLASILCVDTMTVSRWETGKQAMSGRTELLLRLLLEPHNFHLVDESKDIKQ